MQTRRVISDSIICQQRFLSLNIKWILNKKNKRDIKWCFELHSVFYEVWEFFELFRLSFERLLLSLLLKYHILKFWQESWLLNQNLIFLIWADLSAWGFVQSLLKWPSSSHFQHSSECVETAAWGSLWWGVSCWMGSDDLAVWGLVTGGVKALWLICWWCFSCWVILNTTLW